MATTGTKVIIAEAMKADPTVSQDIREAVVRLIDGKGNAGLTDETPMDKVLTRSEVAKIMGVKPHCVTVYARNGIIRPIRLGPSGFRAIGYSAQSVREAMARNRKSA